MNQRTGLPYADALGKLSRGSQAPNRGYANGGFVGGGGVGLIDLSAQSINQLARAISTQVIIGDKLVGEAASRSYATGNRVGAN